VRGKIVPNTLENSKGLLLDVAVVVQHVYLGLFTLVSEKRKTLSEITESSFDGISENEGNHTCDNDGIAVEVNHCGFLDV